VTTPPPKEVARDGVREVFHLSVTRTLAHWLATALLGAVVVAPVALHTSGAPTPEPAPPAPLGPSVPLLEASADAGVPVFARVVLGTLPSPGPNQKRAGECDAGRSQVELNGGCWVQTTHPPPCPLGKQWEHEGRCWLPVGPTVRPPSAGEPSTPVFANP
jgi:hypothetical protein